MGVQGCIANCCCPEGSNAYKACTRHHHNLLSFSEHPATEPEMREWVGQAVSFSIDIDDLIFNLIDYALSERVEELSIIRRVGRGISAALGL